jgi:tetratricopeptide (TPR) repeat protein
MSKNVLALWNIANRTEDRQNVLLDGVLASGCRRLPNSASSPLSPAACPASYNRHVMFRQSLVLTLILAGSLFAADAVVDQAKKKLAGKQYDEAITQLQTAYKAKPSPEVKKLLGEANLAKGEDAMYSESMPPRVKYPTALRAYREVLKYDKTNQKAQQGINTIEGIYKQMGRPIPQ